MWNQVLRFSIRLGARQEGITALETAIIMLSLIVAASLFAFAILSAGSYSVARGKEVIYAGLANTRASLELKGGVLALADSTGPTTVSALVFTLGDAVGGDMVNLSHDAVVIEYQDAVQRRTLTDWTLQWKVRSDHDDLLEAQELVEITVPLTPTVVLNPPLRAGTAFALEFKPRQGAILKLARLIPSSLERINDLR